ncbi:DUF937 domain-containing protein [Aureitalea marina]|uniref:DUF937 domain-containing protein n=1 Tax=Aureitalea marina TaxID=930804 RepID=A0A2S7KPE3_9FLAO|nr:DUF937 domain-containing protein [Aureitalea marina]PQB04477.1 hypothetical protein BST85_05855 [Aureitalea marina]
MNGILDLLQGSTGDIILSGLSQESGQSKDNTAQVVQMALPILLGAMKRNSSTEAGSSGLLSALDSKHDGSILDHLDGFFSGGVDADQMEDGNGILGHVLGGSQNGVTQALSAKSGMDTGSIVKILTVLAPIVLGYLGKQKRQQQVADSGDLGALLGSLGGDGNQQSMIESLLDGDNDGSIIDDMAGMFLGGDKGSSKGSGLGGLLGGFLKG